MSKFLHLGRVVVNVASFLAALLLQASCGSVGGVVSSSATGGDTTSTGTAADSLSNTETQLFNDGPVDLPVTIAKLDSPDLSLITVTVEALPAQLTQVAAPTHRFTVTGSAGAGGRLADGTFAPKLFVFNATTEEQSISAVNADGSFVGQIDGTLTDTIILASMTDPEDQVSPILAIAVDEDGNVAIATTNSTDLTVNQNLMTDALGNYYFSIANDDGTFQFLRRNLEGTAVETVASALTSEPRAVSATSGSTVTVLLQDGRVVRFTPPATGLAKPFLASGGTTGLTSSDWDQTQAASGLVAASSARGAPPGRGLLSSSSENTLLITNQADVNGEPIDDERFLHLVDLTGTAESQTILNDSETDSVFADIGETDKVYAFVSPIDADTYSLYRFDLVDLSSGTPYLEAWTARETLISGFAGSLTSLDVSNNGDVYFSYNDPVIGTIVAYWDEDLNAAAPINDINATDFFFYSDIKVAPDGAFAVFCKVTAVETFSEVEGEQFNGAGHLMVYFPGDPMGTFSRLSQSDEYFTCSNFNPGSYFIDSDDRIHFYKVSISGTTADAQLGIIDPRQNSLFDGRL